ncbi:ABC transporter permease [Thalassotalea insulae]|uniref:ABC transporter permease n=1 Tax=Thalassotalea insulae TaxID=2056778 RepID=A0ABQ6GMR9_9GAMM|nr:hypothetical protein [Thalassotalea insulae]GLX77278.1 ABC transporter permease [Thalassotalea insulae]
MNRLLLTTSIKKELWEYKKMLLWLPLIIISLDIAAPVINYLLSDASVNYWMMRFERLALQSENPEFATVFFHGTFMLYMPFIVIATIVQLYYFIACLYDERRDMSILFWRSLPVPDSLTIAVKLVVGALVIPAIFTLAATVTLVIFLLAFFVLCIVLFSSYDLSLWGLWVNSDILTNIFSIWISILPYALWMLPVYAWLMLVSMFANKAPFLWAVLPVVIILLLEAFLVNYFNLSHYYVVDLLRNYFSLALVSFSLHGNNIQQLPFTLFADNVSVVGVIISAGLLYLTYWLRVNRSHD